MATMQFGGTVPVGGPRTRRTMLIATMLALASGCAGGCTLNPMERTIAKLGAAIEKKIADEGVLESWATEAEGDLYEPGFAAFVCVETGVRVKGLQGRVTAKAGGDSTRLPAGLREALIAQLSQPISDEQRAAILQTLGWNRTLGSPGISGKNGG